MPSRKTPQCTKCNGQHSPPRGKKCSKDTETKVDSPSQTNAKFQEKVLSFMDKMESRMTAMERRRSSSLPSHGDISPSSSRGKSRRRSRSTSPDVKKQKRDNPDNSKDRSLPKPNSAQPGKANKSGRDLTATDVIENNVAWPHFYVTTADQRPAKYDQLSLHEFMYGYMCVHDNEGDRDVQDAMRIHLRELLLDMKKHRWADVRAFHALVLARMETGQASWDDLQGIQYLRVREGYISSTHTGRNQWAATNKSEAPVSSTKVCNKYNEGTCPQEADHNNLRHCCAYCFKAVKRGYPHAEIDCNRKKVTTERKAKNEVNVEPSPNN